MQGNGTSVLSVQLDPGVTFAVQSVLANLDSGAAAVQPTLTVEDQSGVVIARRRQATAVAGAAAGTATWALRLDDEGAGGTPSASGAQRCQVGIAGTFTIGAGAGVDISWDEILVDDSGGAMFTLATPTKLFAPTTGIYAVAFQATYGPSALTDHPTWACIHSDGTKGTWFRQNNAPSLGYDQNVFVTDVLKMAAGDHIRMRAINSGGGAFPIGAGTPSTLEPSCTLVGPL